MALNAFVGYLNSSRTKIKNALFKDAELNFPPQSSLSVSGVRFEEGKSSAKCNRQGRKETFEVLQ